MNAEQKKIVRAVFEIDFNRFIALNGDGSSTLSLCENSKALPYPLHYITICWDILFSYLHEWKEKYQPVLRERKSENDKFMKFFEGIGYDMTTVPFSDYSDVFYCEEPCSIVEESLWWTKVESLKAQGFRDIDIELICRVESFRFEEAEALLKQGADPLKEDPDEDFPEEDFYSCVTRIYDEIQHIYSDFSDTVLGTKKMGRNADVFDQDLRYLFGLAAHEKMDHLLDMYHSNHEE